MQDDHYITVYAMARNALDDLLSTGWKLTDVKMKKVTSVGCHLQAVTCSGDLCEMKSLVYPFAPPLANASQVKPRLVSIHHDVLSPQWKWLWTKPFASLFVLVFPLLAYGTLVMGDDGLTEALEKTNFIEQSNGIVILLRWGFYVTFVAHIVEASVVAHTCRTVFKLNWKGVVQWIIMVFLSGYPILREAMALQKIHRQHLKTASEKETAREGAKKDS